jgi:sterol desaturase/sphingolipid hydroxylase (fatty acid hydroxylase superfamily)
MPHLSWLADTLWLAAVSIVVFTIMFGPLQRAFAARPQQRMWRRDSHVDLAFFFGQYLLWSALALLALDRVRDVLVEVVPAAWRHGASSWPLAVQVIAAVVLGDLLVYGWHRACHAVPLLWRFHAVHHTAESLDWLAAHREHPLDGVTTQLAQNLPAMALGLSLGEVGALVVLRGMWAAFIHSNVRLDPGWFRFVLGAPALHHHHHARDVGRVANYANLAPWIDVAFGTYHRPLGPETYALGVPEPAPRGYVALLWWPFAQTWAALRRRADGRGAGVGVGVGAASGRVKESGQRLVVPGDEGVARGAS